MKIPLSISFLCALHGVSSTVFSCDEVKAKLLNNPKHSIKEPFVCVFLEEGLSPATAYLTNIFIQDQNGMAKHSLGDIATTSSHCVRGSGDWSVVSNGPVDMSCDLEITLIGTSDQKTQYVLANSRETVIGEENANYESRVTFISPRAGMTIIVHGVNEPLTVYTGVGTGTNEMLYELKTWSAQDMPNYIASFDNVLTFDTNATKRSFVVTTEYRDASNLGVGEKAAILSSGKSDNLMNKHPEDNYVSFNLLEAATASVHGNLSFDSSYQGYINITVKGDFMNGEKSFTDTTINWDFYASYFEVKYLTSVKPEDVWYNQDTFVIEIAMSELPTDITPIPGTRSTVKTVAPIADNYCKCGIVNDWFEDDWDPSTIWVDVILILDTSLSMGSSLEEAKSVVTSFVGLMNTDTADEFYSRIGVIAVSDTVEVIYNLNMSSSDGLVMVKQHKIDKIDVGAAFQAALQMFADGTKRSSYRENAQQIIYYLTNSAPGTNMNGVDDFKTGGGIIIVNDFILEETVADPGLQKLASDGYFFTDLSENYINSLGVLCEANCFCSPDVHAFNDDETSPRTRANRGCFHPVNTGIPQQSARETCQKEGRALVSIHDQDKEFFVNSVVAIFDPSKKYWIALQNNGRDWIWDDKSTNPFSDWDVNQPNTNGGKFTCAYATKSSGFNVKWTAANCVMGGVIYVCESAPCSIGNKNC